MKRFSCPCCGYYTYDVPAEYDDGKICPVCYWASDSFVSDERELSITNGLSLAEAKENFERFGACKKRLSDCTRLPKEYEKEQFLKTLVYETYNLENLEELIDINKTCCFIGQGPLKDNVSEQGIREELVSKINKAISDGFDTFISGITPGTDIWAAQEVLKIKETNPSIRLICALPFEEMEEGMSIAQEEEFNDIVYQTDFVAYITSKHEPSRACYYMRDKWIVTHSTRVITLA